MFKNFLRRIKKMWIILLMFVTFTPQVLTYARKVIDRTIE
jgi:hypothetical protein